MIICVCTDDAANTYDVGRESLAAHQGVFASCYLVFQDDIPSLGAAENLFLIAHGAADGDEGQPVIGDRAAAFYVNATDLWTNIEGLFPPDYTASVFILACESAEIAPGRDFSFAEVFAMHLKGGRHKNCRVFGHRGEFDGLIPLPTDPEWIEAHIS